MQQRFKDIKHDLPASIVVFFVAVPLCLGIALASGAPLFAGIIAGIVGGIVVGFVSGSHLGVSGPAAGLAVIVLGAISTLGGSWEAFLLAVVVSGIIQLLAGFLKLGSVAYYFPSSVIKGMLAGIGLLIILKQIPHALGYDADFEGDTSFVAPDGQNTLSHIWNVISFITPGAVLIAAVSVTILIVWDQVLMKRHKIFGMLNGPFVAVIAGILLSYFYQQGFLPFEISSTQLVQIPVATSIGQFLGQFTTPDFSQLSNPSIYGIAFVLAVVASLETLLCVEATDKLDPYKRTTPTNRELKAQGIGNIVSGLIGGLPITQVIVRSSANITFGARSKMSAVLHGVLLLLCALTIPGILNLIPLATLAAILIVVGYKLAKPALFKEVYKQGWEQFIPFIATIVGILFTDLLKGIGIGMAAAVLFILWNNIKNPFYRIRDERQTNNQHLIVLSEVVTFLNKGSILQLLNSIPPKSHVIIDGSASKFIHFDVQEMIQNYRVQAKAKDVTVEVRGAWLTDAAYLH